MVCIECYALPIMMLVLSYIWTPLVKLAYSIPPLKALLDYLITPGPTNMTSPKTDSSAPVESGSEFGASNVADTKTGCPFAGLRRTLSGSNVVDDVAECPMATKKLD